MHSGRAKEVLYDSETVLRLVDNELAELRDDALPSSDTSAAADPLAEALAELRRASAARRAASNDTK